MRNLNYIFMVLLGGAMYGTMSSFVKLSYSWGYNAAEISFTQAALAAFFLGICAFFTRKGSRNKLTRKDVLPLMLTGSAIGLTNFLYYLSVSYISASLAIVILMQFTWFSLLLEWVIFGRKPSRLELLTVFFILIGTVMAGNLLGAEVVSVSLKGILLALFASLTYAVYIVANGRVGKGVRWQSKSTLIMVGSALTIFLINGRTIITENHFDGGRDATSCVSTGTTFCGDGFCGDATFCGDAIFCVSTGAIFLALVGTTIPTALFAAGIPKVGATISSILMTVELPVAVLCAGIVLNESVSPLQMAGIVVMLVAISAMNYYRSLKTKKQK